MQPTKTLEAIRDRSSKWIFTARPDDFLSIPGNPLAYWVGAPLRALFVKVPRMENFAEAQAGLSTTDNELYLRFWWEVPSTSVKWDASDYLNASDSGRRWFPFNKGGGFRRWAGNREYVVDWGDDGRRIKAAVISKYPYLKGNPNFVIHDHGNYYRPSMSWSEITSGPTAFRAYPAGMLFSNKGMSAFPRDGVRPQQLLSLCNRSLVTYLCRILNPSLSFGTGNFYDLPAAFVDDVDCDERVDRAISHSNEDWDAYERSWDFQRLPLLDAAPDASPQTLEASYTAWTAGNRQTIAEMKRLEEENNRLFIDAYGLADELTPDVPIDQITLTVNPAYRYGNSLADSEWSVEHGFGEEPEARFRTDTCEELISYAIGCMMGRYSLDRAGLVYAHAGNEGFDPSRYRSFPADDDGIIPVTDFAWFDDDACNRLVQFLIAAWPAEHLDANLAFLAASLDPKKGETSRDTLRRYLAGGFYKQHLQAYKNRPIYWLFSSGKQKAFQCLVYLHRYHEGTLSRMRTQYVVPLLGKLGGRIGMLTDTVSQATSSSAAKKAQKEKDLLAKQQAELQAFDEQLNHYANERISLDLDDGVKVNYAKFGTLLAEVKKVSGTKGDD